MELCFDTLGEPEYQQLKTWFADPETSRRLSFPTAAWFDYVNQTLGVYAWMVFEGDTSVGYVQLDLEGTKGASVAMAVKPELRGRGYGKRILQTFITRPEVNGRCIEGHVEVDNIASQRCLISAGFRPVGDVPDEDGLLGYVYGC